MIFHLDGAGIFRFEHIDNINVQGNIFEDCGDITSTNSYNMSTLWFTSNQDNVIGVINNNIFKNTIIKLMAIPVVNFVYVSSK